MTPSVSVIIPAYNRARLIGAAIDSVQRQRLRDWELIVIDDGSTDDTAAVVQGRLSQDARIRLARQDNQGAGAARNHGLRLSRGSHIAFLDSDDRYLDGGLDLLWQAISADGGIRKLVYGDYLIFDESTGERNRIRSRPPSPRPALFLQFLIPRANPILPSATIVEKDALIEATGGFDASFRTGQVVELWGRFVQRHDIHKLDRLVTEYRRHSGQITRNLSLRRLNYDRIARKLFDSIQLSQWFPGEPPDRIAARLQELAVTLLRHRFSLVDTGIHLLETAQLQHQSAERAALIARTRTAAPRFLAERYGDPVLTLEPSRPSLASESGAGVSSDNGNTKPSSRGDT